MKNFIRIFFSKYLILGCILCSISLAGILYLLLNPFFTLTTTSYCLISYFSFMFGNAIYYLNKIIYNNEK